jgi:hypothetical protein
MSRVVSQQTVVGTAKKRFDRFLRIEIRTSRLKFSSGGVLWLINNAAKTFLRGSCDSRPVMCWGFEWRLINLVRGLKNLCDMQRSGTQQRARALSRGLMRPPVSSRRLARLSMA